MDVASANLGPVPRNPFRRRGEHRDAQVQRQRERDREDARRRAARIQAQVRAVAAAIPQSKEA